MAELKEKLKNSDPDYHVIPDNVHKVSTTPSLSTVSEESLSGSARQKWRGTVQSVRHHNSQSSNNCVMWINTVIEVSQVAI